jgi:hypothetical protein
LRIFSSPSETPHRRRIRQTVMTIVLIAAFILLILPKRKNAVNQ